MNNVKKENPKKKKHFRLTITQTLLIVLGLLAAIGMCVIFYYMYQSAKHSNKAIAQNALITSDEDKSWETVVVNANSGLSADTEIITSSVTGAPGIQVDSRATKSTVNLLNDLLKASSGENITLKAGYTSVADYVQAYNENIANLIDQGYTRDQAVAETLSIMLSPGTDEHSTGLLINFAVDDSLDPNVFQTTRAYNWLKDNAYKYGFILRYPEGKEEVTQHPFDPTAYRYVGLDNAKTLYNSGMTLEEYNAMLAEQAAQQAAAEAAAAEAAAAQAQAEAEAQSQE